MTVPLMQGELQSTPIHPAEQFTQRTGVTGYWPGEQMPREKHSGTPVGLPGQSGTSQAVPPQPTAHTQV